MLTLLAASYQTSSPGGAEIVVILLFVLVGLAAIGVWLWSLIHCIRNKMLSDTNRIIGIVLIVLLGLLGSLIYLFLPRESQPQR
ncbi:hypothetical protein [Luteolibacter soli]|uniref:Cardiolipin synthase N-terminal domain-containing protein n=1 Tax=Luteolibacter soli TaxID=3135280 RepID=A0ABU9ARR7_9BACT